MLRRWRLWLTAAAVFMVMVVAYGAWWYQDRSQVDAAIAAIEVDLKVDPVLIERSLERESAWRTLRALDLGSRVYQPGHHLDLANWPEDHAGLIAHWRAMSTDVALITMAFDAVGTGPLWPTAAERWPEDQGVHAWLEQRLMTCPIEAFMHTVARIEVATDWLAPGQSWLERSRWRQVILTAVALRRDELSPVMRRELRLVIAGWRAQLLHEAEAWERHLLTELVEAARRGTDVFDALGLRSPVGDPLHTLLARHQTPRILRDQANWVRELQGLIATEAVPEAVRTVATRRFAGTLMPTTWSALDLNRELRSGAAQVASQVADTDLALAIALAELDGDALPVDSLGGGVLREVVQRGRRYAYGAPDVLRGSHGRDRRIHLHPMPGRDQP